MSVFSKIKGTIETVFQIGLGGPQLKNNGGSVDVRNAADTAFVAVRALDPVGANDAVTKGYADANYAVTGVVREIRFALTNAASQSSATSIPANAIVSDIRLSVTTQYSAGSTISVGRTGSTSLLMATTDNLAQSTDMFQITQDTAWGGSALPVLVTVSGAPTAGVGTCTVIYSVPNV